MQMQRDAKMPVMHVIGDKSGIECIETRLDMHTSFCVGEGCIGEICRRFSLSELDDRYRVLVACLAQRNDCDFVGGGPEFFCVDENLQCV
jgi:hypothetical protein